MKNIFDFISKKILFESLKRIFYSIPAKKGYADNKKFYVINFGFVHFGFFKLGGYIHLMEQFKNIQKFNNKIGIISVNNISKTGIRYISEIAEIFGMPLIMRYEGNCYYLKENTITPLDNGSTFRIKNFKFYFLNQSSEFLFQVLDSRIENPDFIIVDNFNAMIPDIELNSLSTVISSYLLSVDQSVLKLYKPENNRGYDYKLKDHFILKFDMQVLEKLKTGITKIDPKKLENLVKYI